MTCDHKTLRHRKWMRFGDGTDYDIEVRICVGCGAWLAIPEDDDVRGIARIEDALRNLGQDLEVPPIAVDDILPRLTPEERAKLGEDLDGIPQTEPELLVDEVLEPVPTAEQDDEPTGAHEKFDVSEGDES